MSNNMSDKRMFNRTSHRNYMVTPAPFVNLQKDVLLHPQSMGEISILAIHCGGIDSTHIIPCNAWIFHLFACFKNVISVDDKIRRLCHSLCWLVRSSIRNFGSFGDLVLLRFVGFCVSFDTWNWGSYCTEDVVKRKWGLA